MNVEKKMGRPQKISVEELEAIVRGYCITCAGEDSAALAAHNVYARLERYAADNGFRGHEGKALRASDFRRPEIKIFIQTLTGTVNGSDTSLSTEPVFERLDIHRFFNLPFIKQKEVLIERDHYFEQLYKRAALAVRQYTELSDCINQLREEVTDLQTRNMSLKETIGQLYDKCGELQAENADCRRYIRKYVDPERAANFLKSMQQDGPQSATLLALAEQGVNDVIGAEVTDIKAEKRHLDVINDLFE